MHMDLGRCLAVGRQGMVVQEQHPGGTLPLVVATSALASKPARVFQKVRRKVGVVDRCRTAHSEPPGTKKVCVSIQQPPTVYRNGLGRKTLQLIVKPTTKMYAMSRSQAAPCWHAW
jgi:hypothetical protein